MRSCGNRYRFILTVILAVLVFSVPSRSQSDREKTEPKGKTHWTLSTNLVDYADFGTLNLDASIAVARQFSIHAGAKYNPWIFNGDDVSRMTYDKHRTFYAGMRWWPWFIYSGWWIGSKLQYEEYGRANFLYNHKGSNGYEAEEGDQYGAGISAGYTFMIHKNLNMDIGIGAWGGYKTYKVYACPKCGRIIGSGGKAFVLPSDVMFSLVYVF